MPKSHLEKLSLIKISRTYLFMYAAFLLFLFIACIGVGSTLSSFFDSNLSPANLFTAGVWDTPKPQVVISAPQSFSISSADTSPPVDDPKVDPTPIDPPPADPPADPPVEVSDPVTTITSPPSSDVIVSDPVVTIDATSSTSTPESPQ